MNAHGGKRKEIERKRGKIGMEMKASIGGQRKEKQIVMKEKNR